MNRKEGLKMATRTTPGPGDYNLSDPINSFVDVVRWVVLQTVGFFARLPRSGNFVNPLVFALICFEISAILGGLLGLVGVGADVRRGLGSFIASIILTPIGGAIGLFIVAGILHLLVRLVVGAGNSGFEATFRVASYTAVVNLVSWIPLIGWLLGLYGVYLSVVGIREMHETTTGKAALIVLIPAGVIVLLVLVGLLAAGAVFLSRL
ncbi:MAG: YIP1 family protein [Actinomycetota bacterium]|nr:YIP1 family protein [Actinomycetota bacterium]